MPAVEIPELKRKFTLLRIHSARKRWPDLAEAFGRSAKTLQYWAHGNEGTRLPGFIPAEALPVLLRLVAEILPGDCADDAVRPFVFGPAARLEEELKTGAAASFAAILATEARQGTATLIREPGDLGLVEIRDKVATNEQPRLSLGEWFRIEFPLPHPGRYVAALQQAQRVWAVLTAAVADGSPRLVRVPGHEPSGRPLPMRERRDLGLHQFVCLTSPEPFPAFVDAHAREGTVLGKSELDALAAAYLAVPRARRACQLLVVSVEPPTST